MDQTKPKIDLMADGMIEQPAAQQDGDDPIEKLMLDVTDNLAKMVSSVAQLNISIRRQAERILACEYRLDSMTRFVSHLLEKDPVMGPKIKAHLAELEKASVIAAAQAEQVSEGAAPSDGPTQ